MFQYCKEKSKTKFNFFKGNSRCFLGGGGVGNDVDLSREEIRVEKVYTVNQSVC